MADDRQDTVEYWKAKAEELEEQLREERGGVNQRETGLAQARKRGFIK
jgi:hypothetical protein